MEKFMRNGPFLVNLIGTVCSPPLFPLPPLPPSSFSRLSSLSSSLSFCILQCPPPPLLSWKIKKWKVPGWFIDDVQLLLPSLPPLLPSLIPSLLFSFLSSPPRLLSLLSPPSPSSSLFSLFSHRSCSASLCLSLPPSVSSSYPILSSSFSLSLLSSLYFFILKLLIIFSRYDYCYR